MLATIASAALQGIDAETVHVEVNTGEVGDPKLILVGLPDAAVKESDDRVFSALSNSGFALPRTRTTINLAPGNLRKEGPFYDLPIALGILAATKQLAADHLGEWLIAGELSLSGATRPVRGALAMARLARSQHRRGLLLPGVSAEEAALVEGIPVYRIDSLDRAVRFLKGEIHLAPLPAGRRPAAPTATSSDANPAADFSEIKGQHALRRAIEVAVAGGHNLLMLYCISPESGLRDVIGLGSDQTRPTTCARPKKLPPHPPIHLPVHEAAPTLPPAPNDLDPCTASIPTRNRCSYVTNPGHRWLDHGPLNCGLSQIVRQKHIKTQS
jgi:hypothetical protein